jgi:hypothetical protein
MASSGSDQPKGRRDDIVAAARQERRQRESGYRERALKLFPHVCGRCGREFSGKRLKELTVHHKDHNHDYNPPDGSNWELLCLYCHDNEHSRATEETLHGDGGAHREDRSETGTHRPFADLAALLEKKR